MEKYVSEFSSAWLLLSLFQLLSTPLLLSKHVNCYCQTLMEDGNQPLFSCIKSSAPSIFVSSSYSIHLSSFWLSRPTSETLLFPTLPATPIVLLSADCSHTLYVLLFYTFRTSNLITLSNTLAVVLSAACPITHHHRSSSPTTTSTLLKLSPLPAFYPPTQHSPSYRLYLLSHWQYDWARSLILVQH